MRDAINHDRDKTKEFSTIIEAVVDAARMHLAPSFVKQNSNMGGEEPRWSMRV
jgi:hypothetical protein